MKSWRYTPELHSFARTAARGDLLVMLTLLNLADQNLTVTSDTAKIAAESGLSRSSVYTALQHLDQQGLTAPASEGRLQLHNVGTVRPIENRTHDEPPAPPQPPPRIPAVRILNQLPDSTNPYIKLAKAALRILQHYRVTTGKRGDRQQESMTIIRQMLETGITEPELIAAVDRYRNDASYPVSVQYRKLAHNFFQPEYVSQWLEDTVSPTLDRTSVDNDQNFLRQQLAERYKR